MAEKKTDIPIETYRQTGRKRRNEGISRYEIMKMEKLRSCDVLMKVTLRKLKNNISSRVHVTVLFSDFPRQGLSLKQALKSSRKTTILLLAPMSQYISVVYQYYLKKK
jgi:hypothetical protein